MIRSGSSFCVGSVKNVEEGFNMLKRCSRKDLLRLDESQKTKDLSQTWCRRRYASIMSDPENKGKFQRGINFDTLGSWNNRLALPILYEQSIKMGKIVPRVPVDEIGLTTTIGRRDYNEDRYVKAEISPELLYLGVFDGHGGDYAAEYVSTHLIDHIAYWLNKTDQLGSVLEKSFDEINNVITRHLFYYHLDKETFKSGTTATVCLLRSSTELVLGHVGDSLALLCREGKALRLSEDHSPENVDEIDRIYKQGGHITHNSYGTPHINGRLAMTRSLGDIDLKSFGVIATPQLRSIKISHSRDAFLVLCSDGLTYAMSDDEIVSLVSSCDTPQEAAMRLSDQAQHFGSEDNITVMVVPLGAWGKYRTSATNLHYNFGRSLNHMRSRNG